MTAPGRHLQPTAPIAPRVLLPGDPGRALALAQLLLERPLMANHARGLWGYTGAASDGEPLTIQASGLGGPSTAIVLQELCDLGAELVVRLGTAAALDPALGLGALLAADPVLPGDGTARALGATAPLHGDPGLTAGLTRAAGAAGPVASADLWPRGDAPAIQAEPAARALDLSAAAVLAVARQRGVRAGVLLAVARTADGRALDLDGLADAGLALGHAAAQALGLPAAAGA